MELDTPCIGICSTVYGDNVCRGCKRFYKEIISWNSYNDIEKTIVFDRLNDLITQAAHDKITVIDPELLRQTLKNFNIRYRAEQSSLCWAYYILRDARHKILTTEEAGFVITESYKNYKLTELYQTIDKELLNRAEKEFKIGNSRS
jgi:predicted Fe-S protein YdhL (DUF1289 family)